MPKNSKKKKKNTKTKIKGCITFMVCTYHIFLINSSLNEHLSFFYHLAILNNAAISIDV